MTSMMAHVDGIDGTDDTSVVAAWTHTDGMAHRCLADDKWFRWLEHHPKSQSPINLTLPAVIVLLLPENGTDSYSTWY